MFDGFEQLDLETDRGTIHARVGGSGPPLLAAARLPRDPPDVARVCARSWPRRFTVVAADLPGYGDSYRPAPAADHAPHSKRAIATDLVQAMAALGFERFAVAGHDRGGRVAYRMALDWAERVQRAGGARHRPDGRGVGARGRAAGAGLLALGVPGPAGAAARAADRIRPRRLLRAPRQADGDRRGPAAVPEVGAGRLPPAAARPDRGAGDLRGLPGGRVDRPRARRGRPGRGQPDRGAAAGRCGAAAGRCRCCTTTSPRSGATGRRDGERRRARRHPLHGRGSAGRGRRRG